jgi:alpha-beta hydrolase superfamily lysophospholipase
MTGWQEQQSSFNSWDGSELFFRSWQPHHHSDKAVIFIHRGHEHSGRIKPLPVDKNS